MCCRRRRWRTPRCRWPRLHGWMTTPPATTLNPTRWTAFRPWSWRRPGLRLRWRIPQKCLPGMPRRQRVWCRWCGTWSPRSGRPPGGCNPRLSRTCIGNRAPAGSHRRGPTPAPHGCEPPQRVDVVSLRLQAALASCKPQTFSGSCREGWTSVEFTGRRRNGSSPWGHTGNRKGGHGCFPHGTPHGPGQQTGRRATRWRQDLDLQNSPRHASMQPPMPQEQQLLAHEFFLLRSSSSAACRLASLFTSSSRSSSNVAFQLPCG